MRARYVLLLAAALVTARVDVAAVGASTNFTLEASAFSAAGGTAESEAFSLVATVGDSSPVGDTASAHFTAVSGFPGARAACVGDCNGDQLVTVDDLLTAVNIALGQRPVADCGTIDVDNDGRVTVDELVIAVNSALVGCSGT